MWKAVLAGTTALAIAGSSLVYAQQGAPAPQRWQPSQQDREAFAAARIAALKAGLQLTPEQEKNWPAFEAALKDFSRYRLEQRTARVNRQPTDNPTERLRRRAEAFGNAAAALKKLADAQEPLYNSLDEAQKRRFGMLASAMRGQAWRYHHRRAMGFGRGQGFDRPGRGGEGWRGRRGDNDQGPGPMEQGDTTGEDSQR